MVCKLFGTWIAVCCSRRLAPLQTVYSRQEAQFDQTCSPRPGTSLFLEEINARMQPMSFGWRGFTAAFIVLWAMMDLTVPGVCQSDDLEATLASTLSVHQAVPVSGTNAISDTPTDNSPAQDRPGPEDCFCCSSHIAPSAVFHVSALALFMAIERPYSIGSPHDFSSFLYHPPEA